MLVCTVPTTTQSKQCTMGSSINYVDFKGRGRVSGQSVHIFENIVWTKVSGVFEMPKIESTIMDSA